MPLPLWARVGVKTIEGTAKGLLKAPGALWGGAKAMHHQLTGFSGLGVGAFLPGAAKLLIPGLLVGAAGLGMASRNLLGGGYSMEGAARGYTPGAYSPYEDTPMAFGTYRRSWMDSGASGDLLLSLHNQRKA